LHGLFAFLVTLIVTAAGGGEEESRGTGKEATGSSIRKSVWDIISAKVSCSKHRPSVIN
jgi:hypothetical protein